MLKAGDYYNIMKDNLIKMIKVNKDRASNKKQA